MAFPPVPAAGRRADRRKRGSGFTKVKKYPEINILNMRDSLQRPCQKARAPQPSQRVSVWKVLATTFHSPPTFASDR